MKKQFCIKSACCYVIVNIIFRSLQKIQKQSCKTTAFKLFQTEIASDVKSKNEITYSFYFNENEILYMNLNPTSQHLKSRQSLSPSNVWCPLKDLSTMTFQQTQGVKSDNVQCPQNGQPNSKVHYELMSLPLVSFVFYGGYAIFFFLSIPIAKSKKKKHVLLQGSFPCFSSNISKITVDELTFYPPPPPLPLEIIRKQQIFS